MALFSFPGFIILYMICVSSLICSDVCKATGPCSCEFSNGTGIDLSPAVPAKYYTTDTFVKEKGDTVLKLSTFYYHPCFDTNFNFTVNPTTDTCVMPLSLCHHLQIMKRTNAINTTFASDEERYEYLGSSNYSVFSAQGDSITYNNIPSTTTVLLKCTLSGDSNLQVQSLLEPNGILLAFYSPYACLKQIEVGRSLGSTLLIIFFSFVVFYLVLGICAKKFLMGATGIEIVPNLAFWSDLPNLVKDGWLFMINGFKLPARGAGPTISPDPNSYDSI